MVANEITSSYELLLQLKKSMPNADPKQLAKLIGNDWTRVTQDIRCTAIGLFSRCDTSEVIHWEALGQSGAISHKNAEKRAFSRLSRLQAYRVLAFFPDPIIGKDSYDKGTKYDCESFYHGTSFWLVNNAKHLGLENHLRASVYGGYEGYYLLTLKRYEMINRLLEIDVDLDSRLTPVFWLLAEAAACRTRKKNTQKYLEKNELISKNKLYEMTIDCINALDDGKAMPHGFEGRAENMANFHLLMNSIARMVADADKAFRDIFFKPYLSAQRHWARESKKLNTPVSQGKPGPRLGKPFPPHRTTYKPIRDKESRM